MKDGVKEFRLTAEPVTHPFAPGMVVKCWGYNGSTPGPTIECVEGDRVRFFVTNKLPEHTTVHWHGLFLPSGMDGVGGLNQPLTVEERAAQDPGRGLRVYRTRGGLRCLVTDLPQDPAVPQSEAILRSFGCDPHYLRLCTAQECFRARLTPKPWRCRLAKPPGRYPWDDPEEESRCRQWEQRYQAAIAGCAACRMITSFGNPHIHPDIQPVVALHDELACGDDVARLA